MSKTGKGNWKSGGKTAASRRNPFRNAGAFSARSARGMNITPF